MLSDLPNLNVTGAGSGGQFFPRYTYHPTTGEPDLYGDETHSEHTRVHNITDQIIADYRTTYDSREMTKDDIFYYAYGILHSPQYRSEFAADLKKMLPRIPKVRDFHGFVHAGRKLADLHVGYEPVPPYPLLEETAAAASGINETELYRVEKMSFGRGVLDPNRS